MQLKRNLLCFIIASISLFSFGQNETKSTSVIDVYPHWEKGEVHSVSINSTTTDIVKDKPVIYLSTYNERSKKSTISKQNPLLY